MTQLITKRDYELLADIYMKEGQEALVTHKEDLAIRKMSKSLLLLKKAKSIEKYIKCLNTMGIVYAKINNEDKAFECYLEALANAEVIKSSYLIALCYINVGACYHKMQRHREAIKYFKEAEELLMTPSVAVDERYQVWSMINYLNLKNAYGDMDYNTFADYYLYDKSVVFV